MHPTQIQVTDTVTTRCATGIPATGDTFTAAPAVRDVLLATANYLSEHGWNQHEYYADTHTVNPAACTVGALSMVCYGYPAECPTHNYTHPAYTAFDTALHHLSAYVTDTCGHEMCGVVGFNDTTGRTAAEVVAMLHDAASWVPGPRCPCFGERMTLDPDRPYTASGNGLNESVARVYLCRHCGNVRYVEAINPDDRSRVRARYQAWVQQLPHDGDPHIAGTSADCDTCERYCFCSDTNVCVLHSTDEELSSASWHVPGDPTFGTADGAALGGAE